MTHAINKPACDPALWLLDPQVIFLNHGSFGACPRAVLERQREFRERMEWRPVQFLHRELEGLLEAARGAPRSFLGADPANLVFVANGDRGHQHRFALAGIQAR